MMGMKTICNRMFLKCFMYTVYWTVNDKCKKSNTKGHNNVWIKKGQRSNYISFLRLLTNENIIFMSKIVKWWLRNCAPIHFLLLEIACGAMFDKVL